MAKHNNKGGLWVNKYKKTERHPDYVGEVTIDGVTHKLAGWNDSTGNPKRPAINIVVSATEFKTAPRDKGAFANGEPLPF